MPLPQSDTRCSAGDADGFRWAKHDVLVNERQSSVDWCIVQFRRHIVQIDVFDLDVCQYRRHQSERRGDEAYVSAPSVTTEPLQSISTPSVTTEPQHGRKKTT